MLRKDLVVKVDRLEETIKEVSQQKREADKECKKLTDDNNDLIRENTEFKRVYADTTSIIDGIMAIKYPEEFHSFRLRESSGRFMDDVPVGEALKDCPEEFRILFYIKTRFISQPKMNVRF